MALTYNRHRMIAGASANVLDFMPTDAHRQDWIKGTRLFDHTSSINLASKAAEAFLTGGFADQNDSKLVSEVYLPATPGARVEGTVYVRKGQHLRGAGKGATRLLLKGVVSPATGGTTTFVLGRRSPIQFTGTLTSGSPTIAITVDDPGLFIGSPITGTGIPANAVVTNATDTTLTMNVNATESGARTLSASPFDQGGLPVTISDLHTFGGDGDAPVVDTGAAAGWFIHDLFITSAGIGMKLDGGDGIVDRIIFDQNLTDITVTGQNHQISNTKHFKHSFGVIVLPNTYDVQFHNQQFEYGRTCDVSFTATDPSNMFGISFDGGTSTRNEQYGSWLSSFLVRSNQARIAIRNYNWRNVQGWALLNDSGLENEILIENCTVDGRKTNPVYDQSTTGRAFYFANAKATVKDCTVRNLTAVGSPILLVDNTGAGGVVDVEDCRYSGLAPGTPSFVSVASSTGLINLADNTGDGVTPMFTPSQFISVKRKNVSWLGTPVSEGGRRAVKIPFGPASETVRFRIAATSNPLDNRNVALKEVQLVKRRDTTGVVDRDIVEIVGTWKSTSTTDNPDIDLQLDIDSVGTGLFKNHNTNGAYFVVSWPLTYGFYSVEAEYL